MRGISTAFCLSVLLASAAATAAPEANFVIRKLAATKMVYRSVTAPLDELIGQLPEISTQLKIALREAGLAPINGPIFVSINPTNEPGVAMTMQIGYPVLEDVRIDGCEIRELPAVESACVVFTGPMETIGQTIGGLYENVARSGRIPAGELRERLLYWESPESNNNMMLLELPLQPR